MATGTLTGTTIATTYKSLLKVKGGANTVLDADIQIIEDGDGVDSVLGLATDSALISGDGSKLYFYDADGGEHISANTSGVLSIAAGAEIDLTATAIDLNGTLDLSSTLTIAGITKIGASAGSGVDAYLYTAGTAAHVGLQWDADGNTEGTLIGGADDHGVDFKFFGETSGAYVQWDQSADDLILAGAAGLDIAGDIDVDGTANLDAVDIDGAVQLDSTLTVGVDDQGYDVIFYGDTASSNMTWDTSEDDLVLNDARLYINQDDDDNAVVIDSESTSANAIQVAGKYCLYAEQDISGGRAAYFTRDYAESGSSPLVTILDNNANNTQPALKIDANGTTSGSALVIDSEGTTGAVIEIDAPVMTSGQVLSVHDCDALTTGSAALFSTASTAMATTAAGGFVEIISTGNTTSNVNNLLFIKNDHASSAATIPLFIDQNANAASLYIDSESTSEHVINIPSPLTSTGRVLLINDCDALTSGGIAYFYSNSPDNTSSRNLVYINNDNAAADKAVGLYIHQDGDDAHIEFAGAGGGGIKFNASAMSSSDVNTLDDYEEGTWTITATTTSGTITLDGSANTGSYTKVGRVVHCIGYCSVDSVSSPSGVLYISLPFTNSAGASRDGAASVSFNGIVANNIADAWNHIAGGAAYFSVFMGDAIDIVDDAGQQIDAGSDFRFCCSFIPA